MIEKISQFLVSIQATDGAIPNHKIHSYQPALVNAYFACFAINGLLETQNASYYTNIKRYFDWHFAHLNHGVEGYIDGTIFSYKYQRLADTEGYNITSDGMDSVDSYAAMFIYELQKYAEQTSDFDYLLEHRSDIELVLSALTDPSVFNEGMTYAKPDYKIKYAMDNSESFMGLKAGVWIAKNVFKDDAKTQLYENYMTTLNDTYERSLWREEPIKGYLSHVKEKALNLSIYYPDAVCQLSPIMGFQIDPLGERVQFLMNRFVDEHPCYTDLSCRIFPWGHVGVALVDGGFYGVVEKWIEAVKEKYIDTGFKSSKFYCAEMGHAIYMCRKLINEIKRRSN